jgi:hypothetical protein
MILAMRFVQRDLTNKGPLQKHYFGRFSHAVAFRRFVFCSMGIADLVVEE